LTNAARQAIKDWITLLPVAMKHPTPCKDLVPAPADFLGYCNAWQAGAGGVWFGLAKKLPPIIWRVEFSPEIHRQVVMQNNPTGSISNLDLEMTGLLLQWIVLESVTKLAHAHVACWCDNTPTVAWATKLLSTKAIKAAQILRILALCMLHCCVSPLTMLHIAGDTNKMADFVSRLLQEFPNPNVFLTEFTKWFHLPQDASWNLFRLPNATVGCCQQRHRGWSCVIDSCNEGALLEALGNLCSLQSQSIPSKHGSKTTSCPPTAFCLMGQGRCSQPRMTGQEW